MTRVEMIESNIRTYKKFLAGSHPLSNSVPMYLKKIKELETELVEAKKSNVIQFEQKKEDGVCGEKGFICEEEKCQTCCPHDERDHGICMSCEHEDDGSGHADWLYEMSREK